MENNSYYFVCFFSPASVNSWWRYEHDIVKSCECFNQSFHTFEWSSDRRFTVVEVSSVSFGYTLQQVARTEIEMGSTVKYAPMGIKYGD